MGRPRLVQRHCESCRLDVGARFRAMIDQFICEDCFRAWNKAGELPGPQIEQSDDYDSEGETRRW